MLNELIHRYPCLASCRGAIETAAEALIACYDRGGKVLLCGNGGSSADCDHIAGELMKGFRLPRPLPAARRAAMKDVCPSLTQEVLDRLQEGLPAVSLPAVTALNTAFANDVDPSLIYAQSVLALGRPGDILIALSTSGNAASVAAAARVAKACGMHIIGLTGQQGGLLKQLADIPLCVPETETFKVQELHLPVYHYLCAAVEAHFFG